MVRIVLPILHLTLARFFLYRSVHFLCNIYWKKMCFEFALIEMSYQTFVSCYKNSNVGVEAVTGGFYPAPLLKKKL